MNKKISIITTIIVLLVGAFFLINTNNSEQESEPNEEKIINLSLQEKQIFKILEKQGLVAKEIEFIQGETRSQGYINLACKKEISFEEEEAIIKKLSIALTEAFPEELGENSTRDSWFDIQTCSETRTSTNGITYNSNPTQWMISKDFYDIRI